MLALLATSPKPVACTRSSWISPSTPSAKPIPFPPKPPSPFLELAEACELCGLQPRSLRNLLHARDAGLLAAKLPGKAYRFNRERFLKWVEHRPEYARLPGVKKRRRR
mgnify:CR=1 FL=1